MCSYEEKGKPNAREGKYKHALPVRFSTKLMIADAKMRFQIGPRLAFSTTSIGAIGQSLAKLWVKPPQHESGTRRDLWRRVLAYMISVHGSPLVIYAGVCDDFGLKCSVSCISVVERISMRFNSRGSDVVRLCFCSARSCMEQDRVRQKLQKWLLVQPMFFRTRHCELECVL